MRRFEDPFQALSYMIEANTQGLNFKDIACRIFPTCSVRTAENKLNRALNPDNHDLHFDIEWIELAMELTDREEVLTYWLERRGYDPSRLAEIRKPTKSQAQLLEEIADKLIARDKEDTVIREQLRLVMQEPDGQRAKKGRR